MAIVAVPVVLVTACGPTEPDDALARIAILDTDADWRERAVGEFIGAVDGQALGVGDEVRTDDTGFAEIEYVDGSLTRLDVSTTFEVLDLGSDVEAPSISVELGTGRMWNRVRRATGSVGSFEVQTNVGVAAVRGTAFWVACDGVVCKTSVTDGTVSFTLLDGSVVLVDAGEGITVGADGEEARGPIDPALVEPDGWAGRNLLIDDERGWFGDDREACNASLAGQSLNRATSPDRAVVVDVSDPDVMATAVAMGDVTGYDIDLRVGPLGVPAGDGAVSPPSRRFQTKIDVSAYAFVGVGLYEVSGTTTGTPCQITAYVRLTGRNPLTTLLGALALLLVVLGAGGLVATLRRTRRRRSDGVADGHGHRAAGSVSGLSVGIGTATLLQQFAVLPLSVTLLAVAAVAGVVLGVGAGWPRRAGSMTAAVASEPQP